MGNNRRRSLGRRLSGFVVLVILLAVLCAVLVQKDDLRAPYPEPVKTLAWRLDKEEQAYNFGVAIPGHLYRSGQPDDRFVRYLVSHYGIRQIISLNGRRPCSEKLQRELGLSIRIFHWGSGHHPPEDELRQVLALLDRPEPVLVHCTAGKDRTGFAIAAYRMSRQGWSQQRAFEEMNRYGHNPQRRPGLQAYLQARVNAPADFRSTTAPAPPVTDQ